MRLGSTHPRINGVIVGLGQSCPEGFVMYDPTGTCTETPEYRLQKTLQDYLTAAALGQYGDPPPTPEQMQAMLAAETARMCSQTFVPCTSGAQDLTQQAAATYKQSWGAPAAPPPVTNALDRTAPVATVVTTPVPQNALTPPQGNVPVAGTNQGTSTGTTALTTKPGDTSTVSLGGIDIPVWALLGAAALGLIMMVKGK